MRRLVAATTVLWVLGAAAPAAASDLAAILDDPQAWHERTVLVSGELVGDYGPRGGYVWVQLNDDAYADIPLVEREHPAGLNMGLGVRIPDHLFDPAWGRPGRHGLQGPRVEIRGVFRHNDPTESGETFIDVDHIDLIAPARPLATGSHDATLWVGLGLSMVAGFVWLVGRRR